MPLTSGFGAPGIGEGSLHFCYTFLCVLISIFVGKDFTGYTRFIFWKPPTPETFFIPSVKRNNIIITINKVCNFYNSRFFVFAKSFYIICKFYRVYIVSHHRVVHCRSRIFSIIYKRNRTYKNFILRSTSKLITFWLIWSTSITCHSWTHFCTSFG